MAVVEKSIAFSVIVPTMHGVVYWDAVPVIFPLPNLSKAVKNERADEVA